jgi:Zn-dependent peptidase ImmA (M78 family)
MNPTKSEISNIRRKLENPYALIEYLEHEDSRELHKVTVMPNHHYLAANRQLLENPYAYLDGNGSYSALTPPHEASIKLKPQSKFNQVLNALTADTITSKNETPRRYSDKEIESKARDLQIHIWIEREKIWATNPPNDPIDMLKPSIGLQLGGYSMQHEEGLGQLRSKGKTIEVAGLIDISKNKVYISRQFKLEEQLFTAAHELGHSILHRNSIGLQHRDRGLDGAKLSRDPCEYEADKFATYFLMPKKLVTLHFEQRLLTKHFCLTDESSFALTNKSLTELKKNLNSKRDLSRLLASTEQYKGRRFTSLASRFGVSVETMAIRLEELELVEFS